MKTLLAAAVAALVVNLAAGGLAADTNQPADASMSEMPQAMFKNFQDLQWEKILPDLGADSPEMCILHIDPKTKATQLIIRTPTALHVRKHWHNANESHIVIVGTQVFACEGKRIEQTQGSFNYMPAKMAHEVWSPAGALIFIALDGPWDIHWVDGPPTTADLSK